MAKKTFGSCNVCTSISKAYWYTQLKKQPYTDVLNFHFLQFNCNTIKPGCSMRFWTRKRLVHLLQVFDVRFCILKLQNENCVHVAELSTAAATDFAQSPWKFARRSCHFLRCQNSPKCPPIGRMKLALI